MTSARVSYGTTEGVSGAATGAKVGGQYGGPIGAFWGAIIGGVVGTATGIAMGGKINKARKYQKQANQMQQIITAIQRDREREAYRQELLSELRKDRIQRSSNLSAAVAAGVEEGSASQGNLSAIGSSISNAIQYMANDRAKVEQMQLLGDYSTFLNQKAQKKYKRAQTIKTIADPLNLSNDSNPGGTIASISGTQQYANYGNFNQPTMSGIGQNIGSQLFSSYMSAGGSFGGMGG